MSSNAIIGGSIRFIQQGVVQQGCGRAAPLAVYLCSTLDILEGGELAHHPCDWNIRVTPFLGRGLVEIAARPFTGGDDW